MRVKIREKLDTTQAVNLRALKPIDKVKAGFIVQWQSTNFYRKHKLRKDEAAYIEQLRKDENLKEILLARLYGELNRNSALRKKDRICESMILTVNQHYEDSLRRLLPEVFGLEGQNHKDFLPFSIQRVNENADIRRAFTEMPILLNCSKKHL